MNEANKKTPRTFQCRNMLWRTYEDMAKELECSVDYLINDAMKQYARQRGYAGDLPSNVSMPPPISNVAASPASEPAPAVAVLGAPPVPLSPVPSRGPGMPPPRPASSAPPPGAMPPGTSPAALMSTVPGGRVAPPAPLTPSNTSGSGSFPHPVPPPPRGGTSGSGSFPHPAPVPPPPRTSMVGGPTPGIPGPPPRPAANRPSMSLTLHFEGSAYPVTKDRFIIGRGKANSDLTIRDPNISRQHALVEFAGGTYYIVDMGSTNGIEFRGQRVQRKAIQNGDVFRICDHEVFCSMA